ncbi:SH3 domain-containing protein [Archangium lansingense]|uniref:SH3 domain-containing protein n=1 Tax=Archangium lansingense TaxID=2995310 RepID=UPI003B765F34
MRDWLYWGGVTSNCYGPGYAEGTYQPEQQGWRDPIDYYYQHRPAFPALAVSDISQAVRSAPNRSASTLTTIPAGTRLTVDSVMPAQDGQDDWWYRVQYDGVNWGYMAGYWDTGWGGDLYMTEPRRSCTSSFNGSEVQETASSVPASLAPSATASVTLRVKNTGTTTWKKSSLHRLGALASNSISWVAFSSCGGYANSATDARVELCNDVAPGATHDFTFSVRAPSSGTSTTLAVQMVQDGVQWFGEQQSWNISVSGTTSVPAQVTGMSPDGYANMGSGSVTLSWNPSAGATSYEVYMQYWTGTQWVYYNTFTTTTTSLTMTPTVRNSTYTYTVKAKNSAGQAPQSAWAYFQYQ